MKTNVMINLYDFPLLVLLASFASMVLSTWLGTRWVRRWRILEENVRPDFNLMQSSTLTLLALVIGFTLSMAVSRYDQRKIYEAEEANAIGTEYLRADLLPEADGAKVKALLRDYVDLRIQVYTTRDWFFSFADEQELDQLNARTADLQNQLWQAVLPIAEAKSTPTVTLAVSGMNDVINSQGYAQAAAWNRIPKATWVLLVTIAMLCALQVGYGAHKAKSGMLILVILPFVVSVSFFLIADIDSPNVGVIRVQPHNLLFLADSFRGP